jgi:hypothetical protein
VDGSANDSAANDDGGDKIDEAGGGGSDASTENTTDFVGSDVDDDVNQISNAAMIGGVVGGVLFGVCAAVSGSFCCRQKSLQTPQTLSKSSQTGGLNMWTLGDNSEPKESIYLEPSVEQSMLYDSGKVPRQTDYSPKGNNNLGLVTSDDGSYELIATVDPGAGVSEGYQSLDLGRATYVEMHAQIDL